MKQNKIVPGASAVNVSTDDINKWKRYYLEILDEVFKSAEIKKKYKHSLCSRIFYTIMTPIGAAVCCGPCIAWDCACCCLSLCCKNPFKYGAGIKCVSDSCDAIYEDERVKWIEDFRKRILNTYPDELRVALHDLCMVYLDKFKECIKEGKAREANMIRGLIVDMIKLYAHGIKYLLLKDDGNIEKLEDVIRSLLVHKSILY